MVETATLTDFLLARIAEDEAVARAGAGYYGDFAGFDWWELESGGTVTCDADVLGLDGTRVSTRPCHERYSEDGYEGAGWVHTQDGRDLCPRHSVEAAAGGT